MLEAGFVVWYRPMKATGTSVLFSALLFLVGVSSASADTVISTNITENAVWTAANGPYVLESAVQVVAGVTLTIEPGVEVISSGGVRRITVAGELIAGALDTEQVALTDTELSLEGGSVRVQNGIIQLTNSGTSGTFIYAPSGSLHLENVRIIAPGVQYPVVFTGETLFTHSSTTIEGALVNGFKTAGEFYGDTVWTADYVA